MSEVESPSGERFHPLFHRGWGGFHEELFHYTSRYYAVTEAFLRQLASRPGFTMAGYKAARLKGRQRFAMAGVLAYPPNAASASAVVDIVTAVVRGETNIDDRLLKKYPARSNPKHTDELVGHARKPHPLSVDAIEPWLAMAERLQMAVAVHDHHVEVDMKLLASHLDSPNPVQRTNLQQGIVELHQAGYVLRNHPHLTHAEAQEIGDEGAV